MKFIKVTVYLLLLFGLIAGCAQEPKDQSEHKQPAVALEGETTILASVNGSPVTKYELEQAIVKLFGKQKRELKPDSSSLVTAMRL